MCDLTVRLMPHMSRTEESNKIITLIKMAFQIIYNGISVDSVLLQGESGKLFASRECNVCRSAVLFSHQLANFDARSLFGMRPTKHRWHDKAKYLCFPTTVKLSGTRKLCRAELFNFTVPKMKQPNLTHHDSTDKRNLKNWMRSNDMSRFALLVSSSGIKCQMCILLETLTPSKHTYNFTRSPLISFRWRQVVPVYR